MNQWLNFINLKVVPPGQQEYTWRNSMAKKLDIKQGDVFVSKAGVVNTVVEYKNSMNVYVRNDKGIVYKTTLDNLRKGRSTGHQCRFVNNGEIPLFENEKYIPGFEGVYSVTSDGDVYSFKGGFRKKLSPAMNVSQRYHAEKIGYLTVSIGNNFPRVHTLVAQLFIGNQPKGSHVDHINGDKHDNRVENLRYVSPKENVDNYYYLETRESRVKNNWLLGKYDEYVLASYSLGYLSGITRSKIMHMPEECELRLCVDREYLLSLPTEEVFKRHLRECDEIEIRLEEEKPNFDELVKLSIELLKNNNL